MSARDGTLLAIDYGTQSVRALLFDARGECVGRGQVEVEPWLSNQPGWAEQWPDTFWRNVARACAGLWDDGADPESVAALAVTTMRGTQVCLDADGEAVRPAIIWVDRRRVEAERLPRMPLHWRAAIALRGKARALERVREAAPCNWLAIHEPDAWRRTAHYMGLSGYLNYRLTGRLADSVGSQVGYLPFNYRRRQWAGPRSWHWHALSVTRGQLPDLLQPGDVIGSLLPEAAAHLGLPADIPVVAAGADKACEMIGSGVEDRQVGCISFGTRSTFSVHSERYLEATPPVPAFPAAHRGHFMVEAAVPRGFWMVSWFKREFGLAERQLAETTGERAEALLDASIEDIPPGALGLMLQPYWGRDLDPGPEAKGAVIGFGEVHTRAHVYRAVLEGIVYALREGAESIQRRSSRQVQVLRVCGGGARSDTVLQITADIFNCPVERPHTVETSGLGAAMLAAVGVGWYPGVRAATREMVRVGPRVEPDEANHAVYEKLYRRVYRRLYRRLAPLYRDIRAITGYPD